MKQKKDAGNQDNTLPKLKGEGRSELVIGSVIESTKEGAKTPLVVWAKNEINMGKTTMTEYRVAGKDRVSLTHPYTAFQLERFGYKVTGVSKGFNPKTIKEGTGVELKVIELDIPGGKVVEFKAPDKPAETPKDAPQPAQAATKGKKPTDTGTGDAKPASGATGETALELLDAWVWGLPPDNFKEIEAKLKKLGVDTKWLGDEIGKLIAKAAKVETK